jgi:hypothetical protein
MSKHGQLSGLLSLCLCVLAASCTRGPVELGFWMEPVSFASSRIGDPITAVELATIDRVARQEIEHAFRDFDVVVTANRSARYKVAVLPALKDERLIRGGTYAGEARGMAGFGGSGAVNFEYVANGAIIVAPDDAGRAMIIESLGRGIGRVAIHEFLHQLMPKSPIHDSKDPSSYEGNSPSTIEGYYGDLHWDIAEPWLNDRLKRR